jgi:hypothetical protein
MNNTQKENLSKVFFVLGLAFGLFSLLSFVTEEPLNAGTNQEFNNLVNKCTNLEPQTILINNQPYTKATPNHLTPCSIKNIFGGIN